MTCGIPVVATAVNSVPEIVISGKTGLVARPRDPASLSAAPWPTCSTTRPRPPRMAAAARDHVGEQFRADAPGPDLDRRLRRRARATAGARAEASR